MGKLCTVAEVPANNGCAMLQMSGAKVSLNSAVSLPKAAGLGAELV